MTKPVNFFKNNLNATLLSVILAFLWYNHTQNQKAMDKLIVNTTIIKENDIKQDFLINLNSDDITNLESDVKKLQSKHYSSNQLITGKE